MQKQLSILHLLDYSWNFFFTNFAKKRGFLKIKNMNIQILVLRGYS